MDNKHWESVLISGPGIFEVLGEFGEISCCGFLRHSGIEEWVEEILLGLLALCDGGWVYLLWELLEFQELGSLRKGSD